MSSDHPTLVNEERLSRVRHPEERPSNVVCCPCGAFCIAQERVREIVLVCKGRLFGDIVCLSAASLIPLVERPRRVIVRNAGSKGQRTGTDAHDLELRMSPEGGILLLGIAHGARLHRTSHSPRRRELPGQSLLSILAPVPEFTPALAVA